MCNRRKILKYAGFWIVAQLVAFGALGQSVFATSDTELLNKALANGIYKCYNSTYMEPSIAAGDAYNVNSLMTRAGTRDGTVKVPSKIGNTLRGGSADVSCEQLFTGWDTGWGSGHIRGLLSDSSLSKQDLLAEMGYVNDGSAGDGSCFYFNYEYRGNTNARTNMICNSSSGSSSDNSMQSGNLFMYVGGNEVYLVDSTTYDEVTGTYMKSMMIGRLSSGGIPDESTLSAKCSAMNSTLGTYTCRNYVITPNEMSSPWTMTHSSGLGDSAETALQNMTSFNSFSESKFTSQDAYDLYMGYLFGSSSIYDDLYVDSASCSTDKNASSNSVPFTSGSDVQWCEVMGDDLSSSKTVNVLAIGSWYYLDESVGPYGVIEHLRALDIDGLTLATVNIETGEVSETVERVEEGSSGANCSEFRGAGALGWLICPIMNWMKDAAVNVYRDYVEPNLIIEPQLFATTSNTGTRQAWGIFRDMANVAFIILFLVVIFSQLTGVGIDNYGIKKILPKMIVAAVLINLSYWLCLIVIDVSNIVGSGIFSLLAGLPTPEPTIDGVSITPSGATGVAITAVTVLAAVAGTVAVIQNPAMLLTLLVSAIGVLISVFFLFVLLSVREAAIVVLTVVSPIAFVFYMLPNTKKYMDKWWKFLSGLLLVYPIAALLVGGGDYVSRLLLSVNADGTNYMGAFIAMVVGIAPIFFIPTVLKGSFAAFGKVGTSLAGLGTRASGAATKRLSNSGINKNLQQAGLERQARIRGGLDANGNPTGGVRRAIGTIMSGGKRSRQRNALVYQKMLSDRGSLAAADEKDFMLQTQTANVAKELVASGDINNSAALERGLESALASDDKARIRAYTDALSTKGEDGRKLVKKAYDNAVSNGMSESAAKTFSDNIMANHAADYKNNHRSLFAVVQGINSGSGPVQTTSDYLSNATSGGAPSGRAELASKVTASTIGNMDDEVFDEIFGGGVIPAGMTSDQSEQIGATAYAALNDQNANIKADRRAALEGLVAASGYKPKAKTVAFGENSNEMQALTNIETATASSAVNTGAIRRDTRHLESIDISAGRTADNTLRSANTTDQIYGEVQYANQQLGDISDNTELNAVLTDEGNRFAERTANATETGNRFAERTANATERGADATELVVDHTQRTAENTAQTAANTARTATNTARTATNTAQTAANTGRTADNSAIIIDHTQRAANAAEQGADAAKIVIRHTRRTADNTTPPKPPKP